jgi:uncharacterized lipoprotein YddW (UPF0748 family)
MVKILALLVAWSATWLHAASPLPIELVVRTVNNFHSPADVVSFFDSAQQAGVSVVHLNVKQDEDDERPSGHVYYASSIAPIAHGYAQFDVLAHAITQARKHKMQIYAWVPQFHDQALAKAHPTWQMMHQHQGRSVPFQGKGRLEYFVNPLHPGVQGYQLSIIQELATRYDIDGISLDWLRFDDYAMDTGPLTRALALQEIGLDPIALDFSVSSPERTRWNHWRSQKIADYTQQVRQTLQAIKPQVKLAAFILPPEFTEVGQDLTLFSAALDSVMPMAYFEDWQFPASWVAGRLMQDVVANKASTTRLKPTLDGSGTLQENIRIVRRLQRRYPKIESIVWFSAFRWHQADMQRIVQIHRRAAGLRSK